MYIDDLSRALPAEAHCSIYADDSKIYTVNNAGLLQEAIDCLVFWSKQWELDISIEKTYIMTFGSHPDHTFTLNGVTLKHTNKIRDLGITYSDKFDFGDYISDITSKATYQSNYLLRAFHTRKPRLLFKLFTVYVRPLLEYCSPLWSPQTRANIEKVQKSFT